MKLVPLPRATRSMEAIYSYIAKDSGIRNADAVSERIYKTFARLLAFPNSGHAALYPGTREIVVTGTQYLIRYRIVKTEIQIIDVKHGAQNK